MKYLKGTVLLILAIALVLSFPIAGHAEEVQAIGIENTVDTLNASKGAVKKYTFEMQEDGQAMLWFQNKQNGWKGTAKVYETAEHSAIAEIKIDGKQTDIIATVQDLKVGKYEVEIEVTAVYNNLKTDSLQYEICVVPLTLSAVPEREKGNVATVSKAKEIICEFGGTYFIKLYDGEAKAALWHFNQSGGNHYLPVLYSSDKNAVAYYISSNQRIVECEDTKASYFHAMGGFNDGYKLNSVVHDADLPLFVVKGSNFKGSGMFSDEPILKQMQRQEELQNSDWDFFLHIKFFFIDHWLISIIVAIVVTVMLYQAISNRRYKKANAHNRTSYSGSSSTTYSSTNYDELMDMDIANRIAANSHNPNYNPESPPSMNDLSSGD